MPENAKKGVLILVVVVLVGYVLSTLFGGDEIDDVIASANTRILMCSETGELFTFDLDDIEGTYPMVNPKTGKKTLFPTVVCYARECGKKPGGTRLIMNRFLGKEGPTYCPNCGVLVKGP